MARICLDCGYEGRARVVKRGSRRMEILIWSILIFPGPFYTAWRVITKRRYCPNCNKQRMVRITSGKGKQYRLDMEAELMGAGKPTPQELKKREEEFFAQKSQETQNTTQQTPVHALHTKPENDHW